MELGLSLGDASRFIEKPREASNQLGLGFNTTLSIGPVFTNQTDQHQEQEEIANQKHKHNSHSHSTSEEDHEEATNESLVNPSLKANNIVQLDLLPHTPSLARVNPPSNFSFLWDPVSQNGAGSSGCAVELKVNRVPVEAVTVMAAEYEAEEEASSPNSAASSFQMDLCIFSRGRSVSGEGYDHNQRGYCRGSDEDENGGIGSTRKKLRLSKEQSAFLEESFKEHNTLNPKQKLALAKQLHLRPRQVEVWFQNRRARTKLKQTEMDCEYLKRFCDTLTQENRRLEKELQELRALKTSKSFHMQLPATTLTMCPSCERVATNSISTTPSSPVTTKTITEPITSKAIEFPIGKPRFYSFPHTQPTSAQNLELK